MGCGVGGGGGHFPPYGVTFKAFLITSDGAKTDKQTSLHVHNLRYDGACAGVGGEVGNTTFPNKSPRKASRIWVSRP